MKYCGRVSLFLFVLLVSFGGTARSEDIRVMEDDGSVSQKEAVIDYWRLNLNTMVGAKIMGDKAVLGDLQRLDAFDLSIDFGRESWPVHFLLGTSTAFSKEDVQTSSTTSYNGQTSEVYFGARKYLRFGGFHPYFGGGFSSYNINLDKKVSGTTTSDSDQSYGYFFNFGLLLRLSTTFHFGVDYRQLAGNKLRLANKPGAEGTADYTTVAAFLGIHW